MLSNMPPGAQEHWDRLEEKSDRRQRAIERWMDNVEWYDVAGWTDTKGDLSSILFLLDAGKTDEAMDIKDTLKRQWAEWMIDNAGEGDA